jgi:hypothetical protein
VINYRWRTYSVSVPEITPPALFEVTLALCEDSRAGKGVEAQEPLPRRAIPQTG